MPSPSPWIFSSCSWSSPGWNSGVRLPHLTVPPHSQGCGHKSLSPAPAFPLFTSSRPVHPSRTPRILIPVSFGPAVPAGLGRDSTELFFRDEGDFPRIKEQQEPEIRIRVTRAGCGRRESRGSSLNLGLCESDPASAEVRLGLNLNSAWAGGTRGCSSRVQVLEFRQGSGFPKLSADKPG